MPLILLQCDDLIATSNIYTNIHLKHAHAYTSTQTCKHTYSHMQAHTHARVAVNLPTKNTKNQIKNEKRTTNDEGNEVQPNPVISHCVFNLKYNKEYMTLIIVVHCRILIKHLFSFIYNLHKRKVHFIQIDKISKISPLLNSI